jgi:hypothetical protein
MMEEEEEEDDGRGQYSKEIDRECHIDRTVGSMLPKS